MRLTDDELATVKHMRLSHRGKDQDRGWYFRCPVYCVSLDLHDHLGPYETKVAADDARRSYARMVTAEVKIGGYPKEWWKETAGGSVEAGDQIEEEITQEPEPSTPEVQSCLPQAT